MKNGIVLSITNHKGGIGKTTTAINLAAGISRKKINDGHFKCLIIDMDPQSNATMTLFPFNKFEYRTALNMVNVFEGESILNIIKETGVPHVDIAPAHVNMFENEMKIANSPRGVSGLRSEIKRSNLRQMYDFIIIDTPPNLGAFMVNGLSASDYFILAVLSESKFSLDGLHVIENLVNEIIDNVNPELKILGHLITMYDGRNTTCKEQEIQVRAKYADSVFKSVIRRNTDLEKANSSGMSIFQFDHRINGAKDYALLSTEVLQKLGIEIG